MLMLTLFSCDFDGVNQSFFTGELGLNVKINERTFHNWEKNEENEMNLNVYNYNILETKKALYKDDYPKRVYHNENTISTTWKKASFSKNDKNLEIVSKYIYEETKSKLEAQKMIGALNHEENLYTYSYLETTGKVTEIQLFVVDVTNLKLYIYEIFSH